MHDERDYMSRVRVCSSDGRRCGWHGRPNRKTAGRRRVCENTHTIEPAKLSQPINYTTTKRLHYNYKQHTQHEKIYKVITNSRRGGAA